MTTLDAPLASPEPITGNAHHPAAQDSILVSVLIPLYNSAATIARAVHSALSQTVPGIEVIVADDASTDNGAAIVETLARADQRLRLLRLPANGGKPHAMNIMIAQARGRWLAVLDADDAYHAGRLKRLIEGAEAAGVDMAADNMRFIDAGVADAAHSCVRLGFDAASGDRVLATQDLLRSTSSFASFDYGVLKPVIRAAFVARHGLAYDETSRLAEDFSYLLAYFVAGGRVFLSAAPTYDWTMPFGAISRQWTNTGAGAWRYDYRPAIAANERLINTMQAQGRTEITTMLRRRGRQYRAMVPYIDAQRLAAAGKPLHAAAQVLLHPRCWGLLARRISGRISGRLAGSRR